MRYLSRGSSGRHNARPKRIRWLCKLRRTSRPYNRAIQSAVVATARARSRIGILRCGCFVDVNAEAGTVVAVHVASLYLGRSGKDFLGRRRKDSFFLDAEVIRGEVQVKVVGVADRVDVGGTVPGRPNIEKLAAGGDLAALVQAAGGGLVDADEIDQPLRDQREPFVAIDEQLAHGERGCRLLAKNAKPAHVLGGEGILHEERTVGLDGLAEQAGLVGVRTLVDVVDQLNIEAELRA